MDSPGPQQPTPPNVVLIIADDQHWADFGFQGSSEVRTPHLDRLATEGLVYSRGYVPTALCRPSLATLVTGLFPHQHGITGNDPPRGMDRRRLLSKIAAVDTLPRLLAKAGYRSFQAGKWWEGSYADGGFTDGMSHGDPARGGRHGDDGLSIGRKSMAPVLDFIDNCDVEGTPFFLWYAPFLPHTPHNPPPRILDTYTQPDLPAPIAKYRAMCSWFDETCGTLLTHLDQRGLRENTLVIFLVDNGWIQRPNANGFAPRSKRTPYEGGVRTPIVLHWPGHIAPARRDTPVSSVDVPATILSACGLPTPPSWPGIDLRAARSEPRPIFGAAYTHDMVDPDDPASSLLTRWVILDPFKLFVPADPQSRVELYHLRADPSEHDPLDPADHRDLLTRLRTLLDAWWPGKKKPPSAAAEGGK